MIQTLNILVVGAFASGKTTLIESVSEIPVVITDNIPTYTETPVAFDFGRLTVADDLVVYLFGTPGARRLELKKYPFLEHSLGIVIMLDSVRPETYPEARAIIEQVYQYGRKPFIVVANKQDHPNALSPDALREVLNLAEGIKIIPAVALDPESAKGVFRALIYRLFNLDS